MVESTILSTRQPQRTIIQTIQVSFVNASLLPFTFLMAGAFKVLYLPESPFHIIGKIHLLSYLEETHILFHNPMF